MAAVALTTIGATLQWAAETTSGTRPTSGYTTIKGITSIGEVDADPETADVTPLDEEEFKQYVELLKDTGGTLSLGCNVTDAFMTAWEALDAAAEDDTIWFAIVIKGLAKAFYFTGSPSSLGSPEISANSAYQGTAKIVTNTISGFLTAPTVAS